MMCYCCTGTCHVGGTQEASIGRHGFVREDKGDIEASPSSPGAGLHGEWPWRHAAHRRGRPSVPAAPAPSLRPLRPCALEQPRWPSPPTCLGPRGPFLPCAFIKFQGAAFPTRWHLRPRLRWDVPWAPASGTRPMWTGASNSKPQTRVLVSALQTSPSTLPATRPPRGTLCRGSDLATPSCDPSPCPSVCSIGGSCHLRPTAHRRAPNATVPIQATCISSHIAEIV